MLRAVLFQSPIKVDTRSTLERWVQLNWNNCCVLCRSLAEHLINWIFYPVKNQQRDAYLQSTSHDQLQFSGACGHIPIHLFISIPSVCPSLLPFLFIIHQSVLLPTTTTFPDYDFYRREAPLQLAVIRHSIILINICWRQDLVLSVTNTQTLIPNWAFPNKSLAINDK